MAINFVRTRDGGDESLHFQPIERLKVYLFGATILFASFGMGEAVYRLLFSEFDGMTDRIVTCIKLVGRTEVCPFRCSRLPDPFEAVTIQEAHHDQVRTFRRRLCLGLPE